MLETNRKISIILAERRLVLLIWKTYVYLICLPLNKMALLVKIYDEIGQLNELFLQFRKGKRTLKVHVVLFCYVFFNWVNGKFIQVLTSTRLCRKGGARVAFPPPFLLYEFENVLFLFSVYLRVMYSNVRQRRDKKNWRFFFYSKGKYYLFRTKDLISLKGSFIKRVFVRCWFYAQIWKKNPLFNEKFSLFVFVCFIDVRKSYTRRVYSPKFVLYKVKNKKGVV